MAAVRANHISIRRRVSEIVPLETDDVQADEYSLVASGQMSLPKKSFREDRFWSIVGPARSNRKLKKAIEQAIAVEREEAVSVLGQKRPHSHLRRRPGR